MMKGKSGGHLTKVFVILPAKREGASWNSKSSSVYPSKSLWGRGEGAKPSSSLLVVSLKLKAIEIAPN